MYELLKWRKNRVQSVKSSENFENVARKSNKQSSENQKLKFCNKLVISFTIWFIYFLDMSNEILKVEPSHSAICVPFI